MTHRVRSIALVAAVPVLAIAGWLLLSNPFAHGLIVGALGTTSLAVGTAVVFARIMRSRVSDRLRPPPLPVDSWDYVMEGRDLAGALVPFPTYSGRVLVLNFWATWCAPCVAEMPSLQRLMAATADLDVAFACATPEKPEVVRSFVAKRGITLPVCLVAGDPPACFRGRAIPATFIIDKTGRIVMRHTGAARWDDPSVVAFVRGLAAAPA